MRALYYITRFLTFPGAMVRGIWEHLVCRICGIPVEDNRLLRTDEVCSHVEHELAATPRAAFALCFVPAFMNSFLAFLLIIPSALGLFYFQQSGTLYVVTNVIAYWFAFSLFVNRYPMVEDAINMKEQVYKKGTMLQKILYAPGFAFCFLGSYLEGYCVTFVYTLGSLVALFLVSI